MQVFVLLAMAFTGLADSAAANQVWYDKDRFTDPYHSAPVYKKPENEYQGDHHHSEPYDVSIISKLLIWL